MREVTEAVLQLLNSGGAGALATVVRTQGSVPQEPGARLLLRTDGTYVGTVGGGAIEFEVQTALKQVLESGKNLVLVRDLGRDLGMCCGGKIEVFVEPVAVTTRLWILGAGHVARPTAALAHSSGFEVHIADDREEYNSAERFPHCTRIDQDPGSLLRRQAMTSRDWLLIVTHDHRLDEEALRLSLASDAHYIGLVGSRRKVYRLLVAAAQRLGPLSLDRVYAPVGLDLGATTPEEIALSIVAELLAIRNGTDAKPLRATADCRLLALLQDATRSPSAGLEPRLGR